MPVPARRLPSGTILVDTPGNPSGARVVLYARVSSHEQRADLDRQVARLTAWATGQGMVVAEVVTEVGAGVNGKRPRLRRLLADPQTTVIVVEHRDQLARFGVEYLEAALSAQGRRLLVIEPGEDHRGPDAGPDRGADRLLRPAVWPPGGAQPGAAGGDLRQAASRVQRRRDGLMAGRQRCEIPEGWVARGFRFEVEPTMPEQWMRIDQHFGARRFAYNWTLALVKANLDARTADPAVVPLRWTLYDLRQLWNRAKHEVAPWWSGCSKEAYASGIADLVTALHNWSDAKLGDRKGERVGFPRFKARHRDRGRVRFTTGAMRLEPDRRHLTLPVIGRLRSKENTRRLQRLVAKGRARVLSMTLAEQGGRLVVSVQAFVAQAPRTPTQPDARCGIDLGIGQEWGGHRP
jgi:putative transposase